MGICCCGEELPVTGGFETGWIACILPSTQERTRFDEMSLKRMRALGRPITRHA